MAKQILKKLNINYLDFDKRFVYNNFDLRGAWELLHLKADKNYYKFEYNVELKTQTNNDVHNIIKNIYLHPIH